MKTLLHIAVQVGTQGQRGVPGTATQLPFGYVCHIRVGSRTLRLGWVPDTVYIGGWSLHRLRLRDGGVGPLRWST